MNQKEKFLSQRQRRQPITLPEEFTDEEMFRDWQLSLEDRQELKKYQKRFRLHLAIQICSVRLYGRFLAQVDNLSPRIASHLRQQLNLPAALKIHLPDRKKTSVSQLRNILKYLGFRRFDASAKQELESWLRQQAQQRSLPDKLFEQAEIYLFERQVLLPGPTVLERLVIRICSEVHLQMFEAMFEQLSPKFRRMIDQLLIVPEEKRYSEFAYLKAYPPAATVTSIKSYLSRYQTLVDTGIDDYQFPMLTPVFLEYLFKQAKRYNASEIKRFKKHKRYAVMLCFLLETRKLLLDYLVTMHDQYMTNLVRRLKNSYEEKHRECRQRQKIAVDTMLKVCHVLQGLDDDQTFTKAELWKQIDADKFHSSLEEFKAFQRLEEYGYGELLIKAYPTLRKYFPDFLQLPFAAAPGNEDLLDAIQLVQQLDAGELKSLPADAPVSFVPKDLRKLLHDNEGQLKRNAWEMGLAFALKDALRSGDLYLPQSKHHISFWDMTLTELGDQAVDEVLEQPTQEEVDSALTEEFNNVVRLAQESFPMDLFARIQNDELQLKRYTKKSKSPEVDALQKVINSHLPSIRIEQLLLEVDQHIGFTRHFTPVAEHQSKPHHFYKTLLAALLAQATNLGVVAMSNSVEGISLDMLRRVTQDYIREETIVAASAAIVNQHHALPLSSVYGSGEISSSDAQRFGVRASSLLASYYPRYYGYYDKAIGIYTHVSDQYSVYSTKVISCNPREALYVLDGLLENNTVLPIRAHTTDTHGYTEILFALCHLLGFYFMPRIKDLKDQQLYRLDKDQDYGIFSPLLNKTANLALVVEQWNEMLKVVISLRQRVAPAHVVLERLINSFPSDRLSKAFTHLGRIIKTQYILRYITDEELRRRVQLQLNQGEYRHRLPRRIFFGDQGEFATGQYQEIMNKASCLSLVSNAVLYWNTLKINDIVEELRSQGEVVDDETLSHISLLPFRHLVPHGTYFTGLL